MHIAGAILLAIFCWHLAIAALKLVLIWCGDFGDWCRSLRRVPEVPSASARYEAWRNSP